jgi:hypothetical protein
VGAWRWERGEEGVLVWVRDRGEHYLLRPLLLAGINVLAVGSLLFISLFQSLLSVSIAIPFSFRPIWLCFLADLRDPFSIARLLQA